MASYRIKPDVDDNGCGYVIQKKTWFGWWRKVNDIIYRRFDIAEHDLNILLKEYSHG